MPQPATHVLDPVRSGSVDLLVHQPVDEQEVRKRVTAAPLHRQLIGQLAEKCPKRDHVIHITVGVVPAIRTTVGVGVGDLDVRDAVLLVRREQGRDRRQQRGIPRGLNAHDDGRGTGSWGGTARPPVEVLHQRDELGGLLELHVPRLGHMAP
jgi:hypothetical protein